MAQKKSYSRYFIILQEDQKGYALASDKMPSGYAKLEMKNDKCKISYYVQNLKKEKGPYYMILICNKKEIKSIIKIGAMNIDDYGRTEIFYEYPVDNIASSGIAMDKITGAAIVTFTGNSIVSAMSGFASTDIPVDWKKYDIVQIGIEEKQMSLPVEPIKLEEMEVDVKVETAREPEKLEIIEKVREIEELEVAEEPREKSIFDEYEESIEAIKMNNENTGKTKLQERNLQEEPVAVKELEIELNLKKEPKVELKLQLEKEEELELKMPLEKDMKLEMDTELQPKLEPEIEVFEIRETQAEATKRAESRKKEESRYSRDQEYYKDNASKEDFHKGAMRQFFKAIVEDFEEIEDLCDEIKKCKWYKVPVKNLKSMETVSNYNKYTVVYYPMLGYYSYIRKYGHFLLGYKYDSNGNMKYLIYGVPGTKSIMDQPYKGKSGFVTWIPLNYGEEKEDSLGYWLMFYDFKNGMIVIPKR